MKSNDYIRFLTEEAVKYMNLSSEEKAERKQKRRNYLIRCMVTNGWGLFLFPFSPGTMKEKIAGINPAIFHSLWMQLSKKFLH